MPLTFPANPAVDDTTTTGGRLWRWNGQAWTVSGPAFAPIASVLVVGGGGGGPGGQGTFGPGPGGGGGGVVQGELGIVLGTAYTVTVGAGGSGATSPGTIGSPSVFASILAGGGGATRSHQTGDSYAGHCVATCAGSIGSTRLSSPLFGTQGSSGGINPSGSQLAGGGGGAGGQGGDATSGQCGSGGVGVLSSIPVTPRYFGAGGGGGSNAVSGSTAAAGAGGQAGGGAGAGSTGSGTAGDTNTGGGGGGGRAGSNRSSGGNGGSGIVVLRLPRLIGVTVSAGVTFTNTEVGSERVLSFTAGTGTVTFS